MSFDLLKNYVVQIKINNCQGTGVVFKPETEANILYILTAKHNFFSPKESSYEYKNQELNIEHDSIEIIHETTSQCINLTDKTVYFFEPEIFRIDNLNSINQKFNNIDLGLIVIRSFDSFKEKNLPLNIDILSIADDQDNQTSIYDTQYSLFGYPRYRNSTSRNISHCKLKFNQSNTTFFYQEEFDNTTGFIGLEESDNLQDQLDGISGAPIFLISRVHTPYLRSIVYATDSFNIIKAIKLNTLLDIINLRIKKIDENLPLIQLSTKITLINENLNISDIKGFDDFRKRIIEKSDLLTVDEENIENELSIKHKASSLALQSIKLKEECDKLSYRYAHIAILAADKGLKAATTSYLKKAIEWNSDHVHILLHEKAERTQNKELLRSLSKRSRHL